MDASITVQSRKPSKKYIKLKKWCTEIKALEGRTGEMKTWGGENVEAPTWELAQQWCDENKGYLKVVGELIAEIPCKEGTYKPDWNKMVDYENIQKQLTMNTGVHLSTMMPKEMADLFMTEIIKSLNEITFNGERKITAVRKYGNAIAVTVEPFGQLPKEAYNFSLASKQADVVLDGR